MNTHSAKVLAMANAKVKKVWGFVIHCGYVESSYVSQIMLHHTGPGFDTLKEALSDLASYFLEDYMESVDCAQRIWQHDVDRAAREKKTCFSIRPEPNLDDFRGYLQTLPTCQASTGQPFDSVHANAERWWPWDQLHELVPYLSSFWETQEPFENIIPRHLDPSKIASEPFKAEVQATQQQPEDEWEVESWKELGSDSVFIQVAKKRTPK